jgi:hypothetical protein
MALRTVGAREAPADDEEIAGADPGPGHTLPCPPTCGMRSPIRARSR